MEKLPNRVVSTAILPVPDVAAAAAFYQRVGLGVDLYDSDYAIVTIDGHELVHLERGDGVGSVYFNVQDVDSWHARCLGAEADVTSVADRPWGMREFTLTDPSGNRLRIGSNL